MELWHKKLGHMSQKGLTRLCDIVTTQIGRKLKYLRIDNSGEYTSAEFKNFCEILGIKCYPFLGKTPSICLQAIGIKGSVT